MKPDPFFAILTFLILAFLGVTSYICGLSLAGLASEGCSRVPYSLENTFFLFIWVCMLGVGTLVPAYLVRKQRVLAALISILPFCLCNCCACLAFIASICS